MLFTVAKGGMVRNMNGMGDVTTGPQQQIFSEADPSLVWGSGGQLFSTGNVIGSTSSGTGSFQDWVNQNKVYIGIGAIVLVLILLMKR